MLWYYSRQVCSTILLLMLFAMACAGYAYLVNERRPADDPQKKVYHPSSIFLTPFTLPFFILGWLSRFAFKAVLYGIFLVAFTIVLLVFRKSPVPPWLDNAITEIGNRILGGNTFLIKTLWKDWNPRRT